MDTPITMDSVTVVPGVPSLFHLAMVKIVVPLFNEFGVEILESAYQEIQLAVTLRLSEIDPRIPKAKDKLLFIPAHLRQSVFAAIMGMHYALNEWKFHNSISSHFLNPINFEKTQFTCYWRYDGLVDSTKTAQHIVLDKKINIIERFEFACEFCLEKSILSLWAEMDPSHKTELLESAGPSVTNFWVKWISDGSSIPWTQAICDFYLMEPDRFVSPKLHSFFPLLSPEDRAPIAFSIDSADPSDVQLCLNVFNTNEKDYFLSEILFMYLRWPLQNFFLETIKKVFSFIDDLLFREMLYAIYYSHEERKDFDYFNLFVNLWNVSPQYLKESAEKVYCSKKVLDSVREKLRQKRKNLELDRNQKKWMKKTGKNNKKYEL